MLMYVRMNIFYVSRLFQRLKDSQNTACIPPLYEMPFKYVKLSTEICSGVEKCVESNNLNVKGRMNDG